MTIDVNTIMEACDLVARQQNLNVCITESVKGASVAGLGAFVAGVLMGPVGVAIGGAVGGLVGSRMCKNYKPLYVILQEMSPIDKARLTAHMLKVVQALEVADGILLLGLVSNVGSAEHGAILHGLRTFFGPRLM